MFGTETDCATRSECLLLMFTIIAVCRLGLGAVLPVMPQTNSAQLPSDWGSIFSCLVLLKVSNVFNDQAASSR